MVSALVTGGGRGLGLGFVRQLLARPQYTQVIAAARTYEPEDPDNELAQLVKSSDGRLRVVRLKEIGDVDSVLACVEELEATTPNGVNVLINNAGYANQPGPMKSIKFPTVAGAVDYHRTWTVNAYGPLLFSTALLDSGLLRSATAQTEEIQPIPPVICNISSGQASLARAAEMFDGGGTRDDLYFHQVYAASKVALSGVTMHMARVLRDQVVVGQIHPGWIKTTMGRTYANLTQDESAAKVLDQIEKWKTLGHSGRYTDEEGRVIPW